MKVWRNSIITSSQDNNENTQQTINWDATKIIKMEYDSFDKAYNPLTMVGLNMNGSALNRLCEAGLESEVQDRQQAGTLDSVFTHSLGNYSSLGIQRLYNCKEFTYDTAWTTIKDYNTNADVNISDTKEVYFYNFYFLSKVNNPNIALLNYYLNIINPYNLQESEEEVNITQNHLLGYRGTFTNYKPQINTINDFYIGSTSTLYNLLNVAKVGSVHRLYYYNLDSSSTLSNISKPYYGSNRRTNIAVFESSTDTEFTQAEYISKPNCALLDIAMQQPTFTTYVYMFTICTPKAITERTIF